MALKNCKRLWSIMLIAGLSEGYGLYRVDGEFKRLSQVPDDSNITSDDFETIIYDYDQNQLYDLQAQGFKVAILMTDPWCNEATLQSTFEEQAVAFADRKSYPSWTIDHSVKLMSLDKASSKPSFTKYHYPYSSQDPRGRRNTDDDSCASLVIYENPATVDSSGFTVYDLAAESEKVSMASAKWLELKLKNQIVLTGNKGQQHEKKMIQKEVEKISSLEQLDGMLATEMFEVLLFTSNEANSTDPTMPQQHHSLKCQDYCLSQLSNRFNSRAIVVAELSLSSGEKGPQALLLRPMQGGVMEVPEVDNCPQLIKELRHLMNQSKQDDLDTTKPSADQNSITLYTSQSCAICHIYEVLLDHLLTEEHPWAIYQKVSIDDDVSMTLPQLYIGESLIDLDTEFNTLTKARDKLTLLLQ